ncbi:MAG: hypothetical protein NT178_02610 [Proteobacteria bacterium]|nr:hypothetical protein [Pseudomonadota bacterium]
MSKTLATLILILACMLTLIPGSSYSLDNFGMLFEIEGDVKVTDSTGKTSGLSRSKDLLRPIVEGDRIEVAKGKAIVVSAKKNKGYEFTSNSTGQVKGDKMLTIKGQINIKDGLHAPRESSPGTMGALVLRKDKSLCLGTLSPLNTAVIELAPELRWKNSCQGPKNVAIIVFDKEEVVYASKTDKDNLKIPNNILKYGNIYRWIVKSNRLEAGGRFNIPEENEVNAIQKKLLSSRLNKDDTSQRLSLVFYLLAKNFMELAKDEITMLRNDFPDNEYFKNILVDWTNGDSH